MNKQYKDKFGYIHELPTKENEVKKLNDILSDRYLTRGAKKPSTNLDIPKDTVTSKSEAVKKYFDEYNEQEK